MRTVYHANTNANSTRSPFLNVIFLCCSIFICTMHMKLPPSLSRSTLWAHTFRRFGMANESFMSHSPAQLFSVRNVCMWYTRRRTYRFVLQNHPPFTIQIDRHTDSVHDPRPNWSSRKSNLLCFCASVSLRCVHALYIIYIGAQCNCHRWNENKTSSNNNSSSKHILYDDALTRYYLGISHIA